MNLSEEVNFEDYVSRPEKVSGAEIACIAQQAGMQAVRNNSVGLHATKAKHRPNKKHRLSCSVTASTMPHARICALALLMIGVRTASAYPGYFTCDRPLIAGHVIMGSPAVAESQIAVSIGAGCGQTYNRGDQLPVAIHGGGTFLLEVSGARISSAEATCDGRRLANIGGVIDTSASTGTIEAWIGRATSAAGPVRISSNCSMHPASSTTSPSTSSTSPPPPAALKPPPAALPPPASTFLVSSSTGGSPNISSSLCFGSSCELSLTYKATSDVVELELVLKKHAWLSVGISSDGSMSSTGAGSPVIVAEWNGTVATTTLYTLTGKTDGDIRESSAYDAAVSRSQGISTLRVAINYTDTCGRGEFAACRGETTLIMAYGAGDKFAMHENHYSVKVDFTQVASGNAQVENVNRISGLHIAHGITMGLAWLVLTPIGVLAAAFRHRCDWLTQGSPQRWFVFHRLAQVLSGVLTLAGAIIGFVMVDGAHVESNHARIGVTAFTIACAQILFGLRRPEKKSKRRHGWRIFHRSMGYALTVLGLASCIFGLLEVSYRVRQSQISISSSTIGTGTTLSSVDVTGNSTVVTPSAMSEAAAVQHAVDQIHAIIKQSLVGPLFVRLAWHDAGTYDRVTDRYGPRSSMRFQPEAGYSSNRGLDRARSLLEPVKAAVPQLSYADIWQLAGAVSIESMGGPKIPFRVGRTDASGPADCAPDGMLVSAHDTAADLRDAFYRMGFDDRQIVALSGAHTVGLCHVAISGFRGPWDGTPFQFDNAYFKGILEKNWTFDGTQFNSRNGTMMLPADLVLRDDPGFASWTRIFAKDEAIFFSEFASAFQKLSELGWSAPGLRAVDFVVPNRKADHVQPYVQKAAVMIQTIAEQHKVGPLFVRLAWHDAGTYNRTNDRYGPRSSMRFQPEAGYSSNRGLDRARSLLEPVKAAVPQLSYADIWQLAGAVSIESMGGPKIPFRVGRTDASGPADCAPDGMLVSAHDTAADLRDAFYRMGFDDRQIVALSGAHALGHCHPHISGFNGPWTMTPLRFTNRYFVDLLNKLWAQPSTGAAFVNRNGDDTIMLPSDMALLQDSHLAIWTRSFANDQALFFSEFASAFQKLSELGWPSGSLFDVDYTLTPSNLLTSASPKSDSLCLQTRSGSGCQALFTWDLLPDASVRVELQISADVTWLALGVSHSGNMIRPVASRAVVGTTGGVQKRMLVNNDLTNVVASAHIETVQDLQEASFSRTDGFSKLNFRVSLAWLRQFEKVDGSVHLVWAHATPGLAANFGYHGIHRGTAQVLNLGHRTAVITAAVNASISTAATMIRNLVVERGVGPLLVRLAWHDAGTYNSSSNLWGPRASMRFFPEAGYSSNHGLHVARELLEPVKLAVPRLSYADIWQLAAAVSIQEMGGPQLPYHFGRVDATGPEDCAPDGMLVSGTDNASDLRDAFYRMGFDDQEIVALSGAHTLGRCHPHISGFNGQWTLSPLTFDNAYFVNLLQKNFTADPNVQGQHIDFDNTTVMLASDLALLTDTNFRAAVETFASNEGAFFSAFASAFSKLSTLGWRGLAPATIALAPPSPPAASIRSSRLAQGVLLSWTHSVQNITQNRSETNITQVTLELTGIVSWLALAVSHSGQMISPQPSKAVVGTNGGVTKRTLVAKNINDVIASAPPDGSQDLISSSFSTSDGKSTLMFEVETNWFMQYAVDMDVWFVYAYGLVGAPSTFGYHASRRGRKLVNGFGNTGPLTTTPPSPPLATSVTGSIQASADLQIAWSRSNSDGTTTVTSTLQGDAVWLAVGVSYSGSMISPQPSKVVLGQTSSIDKRSLVAKDLSSAASSAPLDPVQDLSGTSFVRADGVTTLVFTVPTSWMRQYLGGSNAVWLIWAHAVPSDSWSVFGYHGVHRGSQRVLNFGGSPSVEAPVNSLPSSSGSIRLQVTSSLLFEYSKNEADSTALVTCTVNREVGWLAIAVSEDGFMVTPEPSKAIVGTRGTVSVRQMTLVAQAPGRASQAVTVDAQQTLTAASFSVADGQSRIVARVPLSWLRQFDNGTETSLNLLWAHASGAHDALGYHAENRGSFTIRAETVRPSSVSVAPPPPTASTGNNFCSETIAYRVAQCYVSTGSLEITSYDDGNKDYANTVELTQEMRIAWTIEGGHQDGHISLLMQARTTGWVGLGLMGTAVGNGMVNTDIWIGRVINGVAEVYDTWSPTVAAPLKDDQYGYKNDLYDISGYEIDGITTLRFKRKLIVPSNAWDHSILPGPTPIIFAYSRKNVDSLSHYHGPTRGFETVSFIVEVDRALLVSTVLPTALALIAIFFLFWFNDRRRARRMKLLAQQRFNDIVKGVSETVDNSGRLAFGLAVVTANDFLEAGELICFEDMRDANKIRFLDTFSQAKAVFGSTNRVLQGDRFPLIFISHQWLGWEKPDPDGEHYRCISSSLKRLESEMGVDLNSAWMWVDYCCVPQSNPMLQQLAITDLPEYASLATYFIIIAPQCIHSDTKEITNKGTYMARGWCRLEQFAMLCTGETHSMFIYAADSIARKGGGRDVQAADEFHRFVNEPTAYKEQALTVLDGTFTCCQRTENHTLKFPTIDCDKDRLKPALMRIYMTALYKLPDCPLRSQLLASELDIFPPSRYDKDTLRAMRLKFHEMRAKKELVEDMGATISDAERSKQLAKLDASFATAARSMTPSYSQDERWSKIQQLERDGKYLEASTLTAQVLEEEAETAAWQSPIVASASGDHQRLSRTGGSVSTCGKECNTHGFMTPSDASTSSQCEPCARTPDVMSGAAAQSGSVLLRAQPTSDVRILSAPSMRRPSLVADEPAVDLLEDLQRLKDEVSHLKRSRSKSAVDSEPQLAKVLRQVTRFRKWRPAQEESEANLPGYDDPPGHVRV